MFTLKILIAVIIIISQMYVIRFQSSVEGKDERGREIQYKTNNALFNLLYIGVIALIVLHLVDVIPTILLPDILLYFMICLSVVGAILTFVNKNKRNY